MILQKNRLNNWVSIIDETGVNLIKSKKYVKNKLNDVFNKFEFTEKEDQIINKHILISNKEFDYEVAE